MNTCYRFSTMQGTLANAAPLDDCRAHVGYWDGMDAEQTIAQLPGVIALLAV